MGLANARSCMIFDAAQLFAAVNDRDLVGETREERGFFERGVAAADNRDLVPTEEEAVAGRARGNTVAEELAFGIEAEHAGFGTRGDDDRVRRVLVAADPDPLRIRSEVDAVDVGGHELGAEPHCLLAELRHELGAEDAGRKARVVLDIGGEHQLAAGADSLDHERVEVRACVVDRCREAGRTRSDDDDFPRVAWFLFGASRPFVRCCRLRDCA